MNVALPRREFLSVAIVGALIVGCGTSPDSQKPASNSPATGRIVFLTNGDDPYWDTCAAGFKAAEKDLNLADAKLVADFQKGNGKPEGQIDKLRQYATESDVVAVAISVINADNPGIANEMKRLRAKGVHVITVDGDVNRDTFRDARSYYIGTDNIVGGRTLGTATKAVLASRMKKEGGYVQFAGFRDNDNARSRMDGFSETIGSEFKQLDRMPDEMKRDKARDNVRSAIDKFGNAEDNLVALIGIWAYNAPAIANVVAERNARDKYTVTVFDAAQQAIVEMDKGNIDAMVVQNPFDMGYQSVKVLKAMFEKDDATIKSMFPKAATDPNADIYTTGLRVVVPETTTAITPDLFDPKTVEFMTLPTFKAWLAKYGLVGS